MRVWRCKLCKRTTDLAVFIPQLQGAKGRLLTNEEVQDVLDGKHHVCLGGPVDFMEEDREKTCATEYDWVTGKPR